MFQGSFNIISQNIDPDTRAYVYQQLMEFSPYMTPSSAIAVSITEKKNTFVIAITLFTPEFRLDEVARNHEIIEAVRDAKTKLIEKISAIQNAMINYQERSIQVDMIQHGGYLH